MTSIGARPPRLREKVKAIISSTMLCCGRRKEARESVETQTEGGQAIATSSGYRRVHHHGGPGPSRGGRMPEMVVQGDFRKVSGISTEIFRQIEAVENDFDPAGAGQLMEAVEKRGEMIIRLLDPGTLGRAGADVCKRYLQAASDSHHVVQFVEIIKRPGQTLGLYIREGESSAQPAGLRGPDGYAAMSGVFISRIALESAVYDSGLLRVGDEILAVNLVDVRRMSLDDVVIIMSIPRRLVLTIRSRISGLSSGRSGRGSSRKSGGMAVMEEMHRPPPVVVLKRELLDEEPLEEINGNENGQLMRARTKGLPADTPLVAVPLQHHPQPYQSTAAHPVTHPDDRCLLYYNSQPPPSSRKTPPSMGRGPVDRDDEDDGTRWYAGQPYQQDNRTMVVTRQPKGHQQDQLRYAKTLETLAEQVHSFYPGHPPPHNVGPPTHAPPPPPPLAIGTGGSGFPRQRYWEEHGSLLRRQGQLPRAESDQRIPLLGSSGDLGAFDRYGTVGARTLRTSLRAPSSMQARGRVNRRFDDGTATLPARQHQGILRRRAAPSMESASDTEATTGPSRDAWLRRQHTLGSRGLATSARAGQKSRSNSLPRARVSDHDYRRQRQPVAGVRFEPRSSALQAYYDSQDESDGAVSAPELPSTRNYRHAPRSRGAASRASSTIGSGMLRHSPSVFTSAEYRAWMSRAPSTSAIYDKVRRSQRFPQPLKSRIAHSAESLLDSIRQENRLQQFQRGFYPTTSLLRSSSLYGDYEQHQRLGSVYGSLDYFRRQMGLQGLASGMVAAGTAAVPHPTPVKPSEDRLHLLTLNPRGFFRYKPERDSEAVLQADGFSGLLWVHLLAGRGLRSTTAASGDSQKEHFRDLYCVIECDRAHKARTVVRTGDHSFDWDEVFELDIVEVCEVSFLLYSWDPQFRHKLCYKGTIHLLTILRESPSHSVALKLEPRGTLYLKLRYRDPRQTFQRLAATPNPSGPPPYFGVDLESLVTREASPSGVPALVKRCVEEVEKRGLDVVAIYRLCGSAVRKKTLREALERDPKGVDLSSDHVPDINVITSLLKDYLRELPEPLFAKGLFDMLVDGLSVCLPEDPEGNAKLMFSILECLPKINRCAVLFLMDHLKLVSSRSTRNKMTSQHLAVCFGPILMCHTESGGAPVANIRKPIEICRYLLDIWPATRADMVETTAVTVTTSLPLESSRLTATLLRSTSDKNINTAGVPGHSTVALTGGVGVVSSVSGPAIPPEKKAVAWGPVTPVLTSTGNATVSSNTGASGIPRSMPESTC